MEEKERIVGHHVRLTGAVVVAMVVVLMSALLAFITVPPQPVVLLLGILVAVVIYWAARTTGAARFRPGGPHEAHKSCFARILVRRLDRLGRSLRHLVTVVEDLLARGIDVISATEPHMDSTTPTGRLLRNIFASVAEYEREMIRERVVAGLQKAKARGKHVGRSRKILNRLRLEELRGEGLSWREISWRMDLPKSTVYRYRGMAQNPSTAASY